MAEGVAGEHLGAEHDEVATSPHASATRLPASKRVAEELVGEHHAPRPGGRGGTRSGRMVERSARASADEDVQTRMPRGDVEADGVAVEVGERQTEPREQRPR